MKNILVPIDFSKDSMNAFDKALVYANTMEANLRMIHVRKSKDYDKPFILDSPDKGYGSTVKEFCKGIVTTHLKFYKAGGKLDHVIRQGKIYQAIIDEAIKNKTDLIIMGTHGISGFEEFWLGSNAYRVVSKAPCPVITIRSGFKKKSIKKIVLPIDAHRESRQKIPFTTDLAKAFGAEVHVVDVRSTNRADIKKRLKRYADQAIEYLNDHGVKGIRSSKHGSNIADITIAYAVHNNADLISIVSNQRGTPINMNLSTSAQQMVNHSPIPILSIYPRF